MATDLITRQMPSQDLALVLAELQRVGQLAADMQRAVDEMQQQQSLLELALLLTLRGQWDAAQYGAQSAEAALVARNPGLQGKVNPIPFVQGR